MTDLDLSIFSTKQTILCLRLKTEIN